MPMKYLFWKEALAGEFGDWSSWTSNFELVTFKKTARQGVRTATYIVFAPLRDVCNHVFGYLISVKGVRRSLTLIC